MTDGEPDDLRTPSDTEADEIRRLTEEYLETHESPPDPDMEEVVREKMKEWEERLKSLDEDDPLYEHARRRYEEQVERWRDVTEDHEGRTKILEAVADGFIAEGFWLDSDILRTLNFILFGKHSDTVVVERNLVDENSEFDGETLYDVSIRVRELAREELDRLPREGG